MLLNDIIKIIKDIEADTDKEINVIRFSDLTPYEITEIVFVPDFYYDGKIDEDIKIGLTD